VLSSGPGTDVFDLRANDTFLIKVAHWFNW